MFENVGDNLTGAPRPRLPMLMAVALIVCCCVFPVHAARAQAQADAELLAALTDEDYAIRQAQTRELLNDDGLTPERIDRLYIASTTDEQRHRLLRVARHHVIRRMIDERFADMAGVGSMGLSHHVVRVTGPDQLTEVTGVMVVMTLSGFPAHALLESGDVIIEFAGETFKERMVPTDFIDLIRRHQVNDTIELVVMRRGKAERIELTLCHGQALEQVYITGGVTMSEQYQRVWTSERLRIEALTASDQPE